MTRRIAVTGATGFIGQLLVDGLLKKGDIVYPMGRNFRKVECDIVYHLACPGTTSFIKNNTCEIMNIIMDKTREALTICPTAVFVNASSMGAGYIDVDNSTQNAYNVAKRSMEIYLKHSNVNYINYRLPSVYGIGMNDDHFIKRCIDGRAYKPVDPEKLYYIAHVSEVVDAMVELRTIQLEEITLGTIYELFNFGRRGLHRPASNQSTV